MADTNPETPFDQRGRTRRSNALEAGMQLAQEAIRALEECSWDKATAFNTAALAQFAFASSPVLEYDIEFEID